jgi:uncharacterized 2Fe-2S/4Fe-4S cluster protein (DUF4445 family)
MTHTVKIHAKDGLKTVRAESGAVLLGLLRQNGILPDTPCGGKGTCGKCAVRMAGAAEVPSEKEKTLVGTERIRNGYRLSCLTRVISDLDVYPEGSASKEAAILTEGIKRSISLDPAVTKQYVEMSTPTLEDQLPDLERVFAASRISLTSYEPSLLQELPDILRNSGFKVTLAAIGGRLIAVEPGDTTGRLFGAAFDIGTTTVAAYLYDLNTGECTAVASMLNPQREFGADVISRISHTMQSKEAGPAMQRLITDCIGDLLDRLARASGTKNEEIYIATFAGNTTMTHLMLGLNAAAMAAAPFIPVTAGMLQFSPKDLKLRMNQNGAGVVLPCVSAYVGADTVAAILSSGMYEAEEPALLVDIGTNGEIALGCREWMTACATAAGPAFEGANIRNGVGGVKGAIDTVGQAPDFRYTTIGNESPVGICGSGIIDAVAALLEAGLMDETGRLLDEDEAAELGAEYAGRIVQVDGMRAFRLVAEGENGAPAQIVITQKDIRELQNAKAAIAAGIDTLVELAGLENRAVSRIHLAGGFGSSINIRSALKTGLLPAGYEGRIQAIGNASGTGASECLLSGQMLEVAGQIRQKVRYIELSASPSFTGKYVDNMLFPE